MFFGSKYVYKYAHSEEESVSEDEEYALPTSHSHRRGEQHEETASSASRQRKHLRKPDTNVLSIKFDRLLQPGEMHAGDPVYCTQCGAIASNLSKVQVEPQHRPDNGSETVSKPTWHCEFCPNVNQVDIEQSDLPKEEDATYLLSPAPLVQGSDMTGVDDAMVFFLIDVSGSMSSTTLVQGKFRLLQGLREGDRAAENFGGEQMIRQRNQTYVSRLQGVQMAVAANLDKLVKDSPTKKALLLTFNHEITYYGDGTRAEPLTIRGDKLNSNDALLQEAERELNTESKPIIQTKDKLTKHVYELEEGGQTALGPAVVFALSIAAKRAGSRLVICTDGLANRGLGNLESAQDEKIDPALKLQALDEANRFYAELTERARDKGVSISVITIKGTTCLLPVIGQLADGTGGSVTIVDLLNMRDEFASILEQKVIATNVEATLVLHRGLYIRNPDNLEEKLQKVTRNIGNATKQTEVTFEFGVMDKEELKEKYHMHFDDCKQLPFQVHVTYISADGSKALRVLTQLKETTDNREVAEIHAVRSVIAENHIRHTANDMMGNDSDDDEESEVPTRRSKWSTPEMQKQRLAYMDKLNNKVRSRAKEETDRFNEKRWKATSDDLQSHVKFSRSHKKEAIRKGAGYHQASLASHGDAKSKEETETMHPRSMASKGASRKSFGFSVAKASRADDQQSEHLYRYKNMSSDYMREDSPTRDDEEDEETAAPVVRSTGRFAPKKKDDSKH